MISDKLKVVVTKNSPFVLESNGKYSGFEIELWEEIAKQIGASFEYEKHNFQELIPLVADKKADIALGAITINEKREEIVDFSHPTFHSGLQILLSKTRSKINFSSTIKLFFTDGYKQLIKPLIALVFIAFVFSNILWFIERNGTSIAHEYFPGILNAFWVSFGVIIGMPDGMLHFELQTWLGRSIAVLLQLTNLAVLGLFIGELTAFITTKKIRLNIEGSKDLKGKTVATVQGTTTEPVLKRLGATVVPVIKIDDAYAKLNRNEVEAVVFDSPVLVYYALNAGADSVEIVGELFDKQDYGVVFQEKGAIREDINRAILTVRESGFYDNLYKKYFGEIE